jgi:hypothetical protein
VGHHEIGLSDRLAVDPQDIDVEGPGAPASLPDPGRGGLQAAALVEEVASGPSGVELDDDVQEGTLGGPADGFGLVYSRDRYHLVEHAHSAA